MISRILPLALGAALVAAPCAAPEGFTVSEIAIRRPDVHVFTVQLTTAAEPALAVLDGSFLSFYPGGGAEPQYTFNLPPGTSAVDVADVDADGHAEVIAIEHGRILRFDMEPSGMAAEPRALFEAPSAMTGTAPFPAVLVVPWEGKPAIALPLPEVLQIRWISGDVAAEFHADSASPSPFQFGSPFTVRGIAPAQTGVPGECIEWVINKTTGDIPNLPEALEVATPSPPLLGRIGSPGLTRAAGERSPETWPWFALRTGQGPNERVHFALSAPDYRDTQISIRRYGVGEPGRPGEPSRPTPARLYPGILVPPRGALPDFNRDGYTDLLLWNTPMPGASIEGITRAVREGSWPVLISVHLFDPAQGLFAARPKTLVRAGVPLFWFVEPEDGAPLRNLSLADFDGDGHCDLGFSSSPSSFSIWLYRDGFSSEPSFRRTFRQTITSCEILPSHSRPVVILRSANALHIVSESGDQ